MVVRTTDDDWDEKQTWELLLEEAIKFSLSVTHR